MRASVRVRGFSLDFGRERRTIPVAFARVAALLYMAVRLVSFILYHFELQNIF